MQARYYGANATSFLKGRALPEKETPPGGSNLGGASPSGGAFVGIDERSLGDAGTDERGATVPTAFFRTALAAMGCEVVKLEDI
jgi:hypothetical protein